MRLEHCIRRWLGLSWHYVRKAEEVDGRLPRCGHCGKPVHRTKGHTRPREWRDLKMRHLPLVIAYTPRRVVCPTCGVRVEKVPWPGRLRS